MLPSNNARKQKITSGPSYFLRCQRRYYCYGVDVMAVLEDFCDESIRKKKREPKKKKRQLKRLAKEREATGRICPQRRELTNYRRNLK